METETIDAVMQKIRAMQESARAQQTTKPPLTEKQREERKREWLDRWLKIQVTHPQLKHLEDSVYDFCMGYGRTPARGHGKRLLIYGENGSAKSHTAKAISRWADFVAPRLPTVADEGYTPYSVDVGIASSRTPKREFRNWASLIKTIKSEQEWTAVRELCHAELLILDDIGAEHDPTKFGVGELYEVLESRERDWMVITTNIMPGNWKDRFERRIASRFLRNFTIVPLDKVPDYNAKQRAINQ